MRREKTSCRMRQHAWENRRAPPARKSACRPRGTSALWRVNSDAQRRIRTRPGTRAISALVQGKLQRAQAAVEAEQHDLFRVPVARRQRADGGEGVRGGSQAHVPDHQAMPGHRVGPLHEPRPRDVDRFRLRRRTHHRMERLPVGERAQAVDTPRQRHQFEAFLRASAEGGRFSTPEFQRADGPFHTAASRHAAMWITQPNSPNVTTHTTPERTKKNSAQQHAPLQELPQPGNERSWRARRPHFLLSLVP